MRIIIEFVRRAALAGVYEASYAINLLPGKAPCQVTFLLAVGILATLPKRDEARRPVYFYLAVSATAALITGQRGMLLTTVLALPPLLSLRQRSALSMAHLDKEGDCE